MSVVTQYVVLILLMDKVSMTDLDLYEHQFWFEPEIRELQHVWICHELSNHYHIDVEGTFSYLHQASDCNKNYLCNLA